MADYHPLIARAVDGLERNTGENRRALYERARTALVAQLRGISPALNESDITRERLALEDAIRRVESEAARRARGEAPEETAPRSEPDVPPPRAAAPRPPGSSLADQALKGYRDIVGEAEGLGSAAAEASKTARETYNTIPEDERVQPYLRREPTLDRLPEQSPPPFGEQALDGVPTPETEQGFQPLTPETPLPEEPVAAEPEPAADEPAELRSESEAFRDSLPEQESWPPRPASTARYDETEPEYEGPRRSFRGLIKWAVILLVLCGVAVAGYTQRDSIGSMIASMRSSTPATQQAQRPASQERPKIADRVGSEGTSRSATAPAADVAQKVVLYDEDPNDPQGKRYVGSAVWRTETVSPGPGLAPELAIRADVDIPERRIRMSLSLRRNSDKTLPASHTIEILFTLPADFAEGGIGNIPGVLMKQSEQTRGVPLAGLAVKVTNGFFLIGLSSADVDLTRNIDLLKTRPWFDIPIVYNNNKRAILALEKGTPGERVFEEAFRTWGQ